MLLSHFVENFKRDPLIGNAIGLYCIASVNLSSQFQRQNFARCGVAGSREVANIDRSVTPSGAPSKASSFLSRAAMYHANNIQDMRLVACLVLPPSVRNAPSGPVLTRLLQDVNPDDARPAYALKGMTMAVALEKVYHKELDAMPGVSRARTKFQEWFKTTQSSFENIKLAMQSVGHGIYYDFTKFSATAMPEEFIGKGRKLEGGLTLATTDHGLRGSSRLSANEIRRTLQVGDEVTEEDGTTIRLTSDDIEDVRTSTPRGLKILQLITDRGPATTGTTQTAAPQTTTTGTTTTGPAAPTTTAAPRTRARATPTPTLRMTRSQVAALRNAQTAEEEKKRRRIARALAQLTI